MTRLLSRTSHGYGESTGPPRGQRRRALPAGEAVLPARCGIPEGGRLGRAEGLCPDGRPPGPATHLRLRCWLNGMVPRDSETRNAITDALAERLGRSVGHNEVGFGKDLVWSGGVR